MIYEELMKIKMHAAIAFGRMALEAGHDVVPMVIGCKRDSAEVDLLMSPRPHTIEEKAKVYSIMATLARAWGASDVLVMADAYVRHVDKDDPDFNKDPAEMPLPSDDPLSSEALMCHRFSVEAPDSGLMSEYHHTPDGLIFDPIKPMPIDQSEADEADGSISRTGMMVTVFHGALSMTDEQIAETLIDSPSDQITDVDSLIEVMRGSGYQVLVT